MGRKKHSNELKANIDLDVIRDQRTMSELAWLQNMGYTLIK